MLSAYTDAELKQILPVTASRQAGKLRLDGVDLEGLAHEFGTPLYVYDAPTIRDLTRAARNALSTINARISFASKACETVAVLRVLAAEGVDLDVISLGEIEAGRRAGFSPRQMHLHGNAKGDDELEAAVRLGLRSVVLDSTDEARRLAKVCTYLDRACVVMVRLALPLEARTHPHLQTSGTRSKFGVLLGSAEEAELYEMVRITPRLRLKGVHAHLGSQIGGVSVYTDAAETLVKQAENLRESGFPIEEVSLGGGWAVAYQSGEVSLSPREVAKAVAPIARTAPHFRLAFEPGRALVARAAVALYTVRSVKDNGEHRVVAVDGGMGDNPRPALYGSGYTVLPLRDADREWVGPVDVVGRYCETGDFLARDVKLPRVEVGEVLCLPAAGAYQLSMASSYNLVPQPAVVLIDEGRARLVTRRAGVDDVLARELE